MSLGLSLGSTCLPPSTDYIEYGNRYYKFKDWGKPSLASTPPPINAYDAITWCKNYEKDFPMQLAIIYDSDSHDAFVKISSKNYFDLKKGQNLFPFFVQNFESDGD